jgi:hypothetical protein
VCSKERVDFRLLHVATDASPTRYYASSDAIKKMLPLYALHRIQFNRAYVTATAGNFIQLILAQLLSDVVTDNLSPKL